MQFTFPQRRIKESTWFLDDKDEPRYGTIEMISIVLKEQEVTTWYTVVVDSKSYTVKEGSLIGADDPSLPRPKYRLGDYVEYNVLNNKRTFDTVQDVIARVEVAQWELDKFEIMYYMADDSSSWVMEDEIIGYVTDAQLIPDGREG